MATYSSWTVSGASIDYVPIENPVNETVKLFNGKEQGSVPPTTNLSSNTGQYILAQDGTWIPQPSFTSGGSDAFEILRPSVFTPTYSAYTPTVTNSANAYDVDTNHATTFGEWECAFVSRNLPITDTLLFTSFGSKTQTWTSATINISRAYGYFNDGESNSSSKVTSVKVEFSTNGGSTWTTIVTDLSTAVPLTATTSSYTFTTTPTMGNVQVRLTLVRGGGGMIYDPEIGISVPGSTGDIDLRLYDIWISGTYSGGSGNITCNNLTVTGDATFQSKIYDSTASAGTTGQVLKVAANGKVTWATDSAGTGTVTSITTTGANGVTISGGSTQTITTSGTFALALGNITPTSISTGTGSFSGDVAFASSITTPSGSSAPVVIAPDGGGDLHINTDSIRFGYANSNSTLATRGTGDLILTTNENSATEGVIRLYDGANGNITLTPNGTGQVQVGSDQVVTLTASQTLTNKTLSTNSTWNGNTIGVAYGGTGSTTLTSGSYVVGNGTSAVTLKTPTQVTADLDTFTYQIGGTAGKKGLVPAAPAVGASVVYLDQTGSWTTPSGSGTTTNALTIQSPLTGTSFNGSTAVTIGLGTVAVANGGTGLTSLTAGYIPYGNGTSAFGSSADLFWDSANSRLGVGTSSPSTKLTVKGISAIGQFTNGTAVIDAYDSYAFYGCNTANNGLRIGSSGDVGIGMNPTVKFEVLGNALIGPTNGKMFIGDVGYGASYPALAHQSYATTTGYALLAPDNGYLLLNKRDVAGTTIGFRKNNADMMVINNDGNVGIGVSSPAANLSVSGSSNTGIRIKGGSSALSYIDFDEADSGTPNGSIAYVHSTNHMTFGTGGSNAERMRIDSSGNVGIGTSNLTVLGGSFKNLVLAGTTTNAGGYYIAENSDGSVRGQIGVDTSVIYMGSRTNHPVAFTTNNTERVRIDSSGNVGIGASSSLSPLTIERSSGTSAEIKLNQTGTSGRDYRIASTGTGYGAGNLIFYDATAGSERMRITSGGDVLVNATATADSSKLYVAGNLGTNGSQFNFRPGSGTYYELVNRVGAGFDFYVNNAGTLAARIDSSGNLLIGNTNGTEKLTVTGNIRASGVYVGNGSTGSYTKGFGAIQTASTTPGTPSGGAAGDHFYYY